MKTHGVEKDQLSGHLRNPGKERYNLVYEAKGDKDKRTVLRYINTKLIWY